VIFAGAEGIQPNGANAAAHIGRTSRPPPRHRNFAVRAGGGPSFPPFEDHDETRPARFLSAFDDASSRRTQRTHPLGIGSDINHHHRPDAVHPRLWSRCSSTPFRPPRPIGRPPRRRPPRRRSRCRPLPAPPPGSAGSPTTPSAECSTPPAIRGRCNTAYPPPPTASGTKIWTRTTPPSSRPRDGLDSVAQEDIMIVGNQ